MPTVFDNYSTQVGVSFDFNSAGLNFVHQVDDNGTKRTITLGLWDTAGQVTTIIS